MPAPLGGIFNYLGMGTYDSGPPTSSDPAIQALINSGAITTEQAQQAQSGINESGTFNTPASYSYNVDWSKLPTTQYGNVSLVRPVGQMGFKLRNPNLQYNDPNYGLITPTTNTIDPSSQRNFYDMIGPLAMTLVLGGAGLAAAGGVGAGAAPLAGGLGPGAAGEVMGGVPIGSGMATSMPWYAKLGMQLAQMGTRGTPATAVSTDMGIPSSMTQPAATTAAQQPSPLATGGYDPTAFGDMNLVAPAPSDGSQYVATASAPDAYNNSYNQVIG